MGIQLTLALKKELNDKCPHPTAPHTPTFKIYHTNKHLITNLCSNSGSDFTSKEFEQTLVIICAVNVESVCMHFNSQVESRKTQ